MGIVERAGSLCETPQEVAAIALYVAIQMAGSAGTALDQILPSFDEMPMHAKVSVLGGSIMAAMTEEPQRPLKVGENVPHEIVQGTSDFFVFCLEHLPEVYEAMRARAVAGMKH
jgi:hypothetical protein